MSHLPDIPNQQRDDAHHDVEDEWAAALSTSVVPPEKSPVGDSVAIFIEDTDHADEWVVSDTFTTYDGRTEIDFQTK